MATLIHLNGPAGVGKSTLARRLVAERPLALCLDIDEIRARLGQWATIDDSKRVARDVAYEMAASHLARGYDVVVPQLTVLPEVVDALAAVAADADAAFVTVILVAPTDALRARLNAATASDHPRALFSVDELVDQIEYAAGRWPAMVAARPSTRVMDVASMTEDAAFASVCAELSRERC